MSNKHNDAWYETTFEKHLEEQCKKYKDRLFSSSFNSSREVILSSVKYYAQAELEAMVLTMKELEEYD